MRGQGQIAATLVRYDFFALTVFEGFVRVMQAKGYAVRAKGGRHVDHHYLPRDRQRWPGIG